MKPRQIIVTGATGCIGRHLIPLLVERGWAVHGVSSRPPEASSPEISWHSCNLLVPGEAKRLFDCVEPEILVHLAWFVAPGKWAAAEENLDWVCASLDLTREFIRRGGRKIVVSGSCLEYDWNYGYCSEMRTPRVPHTLYGTAKNSLHDMLDAFARRAGLPMAWGRVFFLYGPHEHPDRLVASVVRSLLNEQPALCSHGAQVRDYLYVEDVARAFLSLVESDLTGPVNIASGIPVTLCAIVERIGDLMGKSELLRLGAIPAAPTDVPLVVADLGRLQKELRWTPSYSLDDGLARTIRWWQSRSKGSA